MTLPLALAAPVASANPAPCPEGFSAHAAGQDCGAFPAGDAVIPLLLTIGCVVAGRRR